jgi:hypothetical protein
VLISEHAAVDSLTGGIMEIAIACAALCITTITVAVILSRSATTVVRKMSEQQVWLWNRLLAMIEPSLQDRVNEMVEADRIAAEIAAEQEANPLVKKPKQEPFEF